jgi:hypothetical protein
MINTTIILLTTLVNNSDIFNNCTELIISNNNQCNNDMVQMCSYSCNEYMTTLNNFKTNPNIYTASPSTIDINSNTSTTTVNRNVNIANTLILNLFHLVILLNYLF